MAFKMNPKSPTLKSVGRYAAPRGIQQAAASPAKQTASQKKNLPEVIVKAIAAKSPAKQVNTVDKAVPAGKIQKTTKPLEKGLKSGTIKKGKTTTAELAKHNKPKSPAKQSTQGDYEKGLEQKHIVKSKTSTKGNKDNVKRSSRSEVTNI